MGKVAERIANSATLTTIARLGLIVLSVTFPLTLLLAGDWLNFRFARTEELIGQTTAQIALMSTRINELASQMATTDLQFALLAQKVDPGLTRAVEELQDQVQDLLLWKARIEGSVR